MTVKMKKFLFFSVAIIVAGIWATYAVPIMEAQQVRRGVEMDNCHRQIASGLAQDVDGGRYNVDELCKVAREIASGRY